MYGVPSNNNSALLNQKYEILFYNDILSLEFNCSGSDIIPEPANGLFNKWKVLNCYGRV